MALSRPDTTWTNVKNDISRMQRCLVESLRTCENLEQGHLAQMKNELTTARQRINELEYENASLRTHIQVIGILPEGRFTAGGMTESLQTEVDQHLLKAKQENDMLRKKIHDLEVQAECLKEQVNIYKEDFEMERKDRENAQSLISDLQKQLAILTSSSRHHITGSYSPTQHHQYGQHRIRGFDVCDDVSSVSGRQSTVVCTAVDGDRLENDDHGFDVCDLRESGVEQQASLALTGRGFSSTSKFRTDGMHENDAKRFSRVTPTDEGRVMHSNSFKFSSPVVTLQNVAVNNALACPNCKRTFSTEDHLLLVEHLEVCN